MGLINGLVDKSKGLIAANPIATAVGVGAVGVGGLVLGAAVIGSKRKKKTRSGSKRDRIFKSKQKHESRYKRKRKFKIYKRKGWIKPKKTTSKSRRGNHYTKKGQPYKILANGRARFVKKKGRK